MTGLEVIQALAAGDIPRPPLAELIDMWIDDVAPGRVAFALDVSERLYNPLGSVHGGVVSTLLDSAMACAVHTSLADGLTYTTVELHVNFVRAVRAGAGRVVAEGEVITSGRRVATASGRLTGPDGTRYAHATTTCLVFPAAG
jgi:uncharacterized protein (TIGR00369 family)